jgi:hypothetical protein
MLVQQESEIGGRPMSRSNGQEHAPIALGQSPSSSRRSASFRGDFDLAVGNDSSVEACDEFVSARHRFIA